MLGKKYENILTFDTFKIFPPLKKCLYFCKLDDRWHSTLIKKNWLDRQNIGFLRNTQDLLYQKKVKCTSSPVNLLNPNLTFRNPLQVNSTTVQSRHPPFAVRHSLLNMAERVVQSTKQNYIRQCDGYQIQSNSNISTYVYDLKLISL